MSRSFPGRRTRRLAVAGTAAATSTVTALALGLPASAEPLPSGVRTGPSTTVSPYLVPVAKGVQLTSLLTVGDRPAGNGYRFVGVPDGLGLSSTGKGANLIVNHELRDSQGIVRRHGQKGAFDSQWSIDPRTLKVRQGADLIDPGIQYWDYPLGRYAAAPVAPAGAAAGTHGPAFSRFCSGYLAPAGSLSAGRYGSDQALYLANEENGDEGRVFGVTTDGQAVQLPRLGLFSWENTLVAPTRSRRTVVVGNEDSADGQLRIYVGLKQDKGDLVDRAGLNDGRLFVLDLADETVSTDAGFRATYGTHAPVKVTIGADEEIDWTRSGVQQNAQAAAKGLTLNRIEDGAFDPRHPNDYYFNTTEGGSTAPNPAEPGVARDGGGLWRLSFVDVNRPELGGTLTLLLDGSEQPYLSKPDNLTIDTRGNLLIQEDPGGNDHVARIVAYRIKDGARGVLATFDPRLFGVADPAGTTPDTRAVLTTDEESSGIIDAATTFGKGTFLFDAQVHTSKGLPAGTGPGTVEELVENGQLLLLKVGAWDRVYR